MTKTLPPASAIVNSSCVLFSCPNEHGTPEEIASKYQALTDTFLNAVQQLGVPHEDLVFPDFFDQFEKVRDILEVFGGLALAPNPKAIREFAVAYQEGDTPKMIWNKWIDRGKVHHKAGVNSDPPETAPPSPDDQIPGG